MNSGRSCFLALTLATPETSTAFCDVKRLAYPRCRPMPSVCILDSTLSVQGLRRVCWCNPGLPVACGYATPGASTKKTRGQARHCHNMVILA